MATPTIDTRTTDTRTTGITDPIAADQSPYAWQESGRRRSRKVVWAVGLFLFMLVLLVVGGVVLFTSTPGVAGGCGGA